MSKIELTLAECEMAVTWALAEVAKIPFKKGAWNAFEFLVKEHALGVADAGATAYKCAVGYNVDFDLRCTCCGEILAMGSVDIEGPLHDAEDGSEVIVLARSQSELAAALGGTPPRRRSPGEGALYIWERLRHAEACSCRW